MRSLTRLALVVAIGVGLVGQIPEVAARGFARWAYYVPNDPRSYQSLALHHSYLDVVAPDAWRIHPDGTITSRIQPTVIAQMRRWGLRIVPMVTKWSWRDKMHGFFQSRALRREAAATLAALVVKGGYDGIHIDIENIQGGDGPALEAFVADIAAGIRGGGRLMTMALPARTATVNAHPGYNYAALSAHIDLAVIMAYDHGYAGGSPSPVAPWPWVREVAAYSVSQIPRSKVLLGIPWYGYDWNTTTRQPGVYVGFDQVAQIPVETSYDEQAQAPAMRYVARGQRHQIWYENARSVRQKLNIVVDQELAGWAAWRLGYEDPEIWSLLKPRR